MRTLQVILATIVTVSMYAQEVPEAPETPSTNKQHTSITTSVSNSTSISDSDNTYKFKSKFDPTKKAGILSILEDELDAMEMTKKGNQKTWIKYINGKVAFECTLSKRNLTIVSDKNELSVAFNKRIKHLGEELSNYISAHKPFQWGSNNTSNTVSSAQMRLEKAKEELTESIENLEKVKRASEN